MTANSKMRGELKGKSNDQVDTENDAANMKHIRISPVEVIDIWPKFCTQYIPSERLRHIHCHCCFNMGKIQCAPRWRR